MTTQRVSIRVPPAVMAAMPARVVKRTEPLRKRVTLWILLAALTGVVGSGLFIAAASRTNGASLWITSMLTVGAVGIVLFWAILLVPVLTRWYLPGTVRVSSEPGRLWFCQSKVGKLNVPLLVLNGLLTALGAVSVWAIARGFLVADEQNQFGNPSAAWLVSLCFPAGVWMYVWLLVRYRRPQGLWIDEQGIHFTENERDREFVPWAKVRGVTVSEKRQPGTDIPMPAVKLETTRSSVPFEVGSRTLDSDPNIVAAIIEFYRANADARSALNDPVAALRRFELTPSS